MIFTFTISGRERNGQIKTGAADRSRRAAIWDYREEFFNNNDQHLDGTGGLANVQDFAGWYRKNLAYRSEETTPPDKVPAFTYLAVLQETGELIGMIDIRHRLNEGLLKSAATSATACALPAGGRATPSRCFD